MACAGKCSKGFADSAVHVDVKDYYGNVLKKSADLKSNVCVTPSQPITASVRQALSRVHPEVTDKYYGCGLVVPERLGGLRVLDLGCGSGRDCYLLSQLVGQTGHVTGIDMTSDQLEVARRYVDHHTQAFGYTQPNVAFVQGYIEALSEAGLEESSFHLIISNCVVNLSPDKTRVLSEAYKVLKDGGELYFSDVYSSGRLTDEIKNHKVLWGECLGGALWWEDLLRLAEEVGFSAPRLVTAKVITVDNKELEAVLGDYRFVSATYRLFKVPAGGSEGALVTYKAGVAGGDDPLLFDCQHAFKAGEVMEVDSDMVSILSHSRFSDSFTFQPRGTSAPGSSKVSIVNPFELALGQAAASPPSATGGCCGAKPSCCN